MDCYSPVSTVLSTTQLLPGEVLPSSTDLGISFDSTVESLLWGLSSLPGAVPVVAVKQPEQDMSVRGVCDRGRRLSFFGEGPDLQNDQISSAGLL